jgi:hypothetical protein
VEGYPALTGSPVRGRCAARAAATRLARQPLALTAFRVVFRSPPQPTPLLDSVNYPVHLKNLRRAARPRMRAAAPAQRARNVRNPHPAAS